MSGAIGEILGVYGRSVIGVLGSNVRAVPDEDYSQLPLAPASPRLTVAVVVVGDAGYVALIAGWVVTRSWGWAALSAIALASQLAQQSAALQTRRSDKPVGDSPWWSTASMIIADLVLPTVAVINWAPPWHGWVGAFLLAMNGGIVVLSMVQLRRVIHRERR